MQDYDKRQWQEQQRVQEAALEKQRAREAKARERSARNAKRKLERLHAKLKESGELTDWEGEFAQSVSQRIDEFGSAFADLQKGRPGDALSFAQKRVVASLNKKVKDARKAAKAQCSQDQDEGQKPQYKPRSSFKSKGRKFTPRVRHIEDDFLEDDIIENHKADEVRAKSSVTASPLPAFKAQPCNVQPFKAKPVIAKPISAPPEAICDDKETAARPPVGRPFLRVVSG